jgi:hypothetical protein
MTINLIEEIEAARQTVPLVIEIVKSNHHAQPVLIRYGIRETVARTARRSEISEADKQKLLDLPESLRVPSALASLVYKKLKTYPEVLATLHGKLRYQGCPKWYADRIATTIRHLDENRCTEHWLTYCPKTECSLCQQYKAADALELKGTKVIKRRKVSLWPFREITERRCFSDRFEPEYGTAEQYSAKSLQKTHTFAIYPNKTERAILSDYLLQGEGVPSRWIDGDGYVKTPIGFLYEGVLVYEHTHVLSVPRGSKFIGGPNQSWKQRRTVWEYPQSFREPNESDLKDLQRLVAELDAEQEAFERSLTGLSLDEKDARVCARRLADEFPTIQFRVESGELQCKKPSAEKWKVVYNGTPAHKPVVRVDATGQEIYPTAPADEHFQDYAFSHLAPNDTLGGGMVQAKSQSAKYNFRILEESIFPAVFSGSVTSDIKWLPAEERPALYMNPTQYWPTIPKIQSPRTPGQCNHKSLGLAASASYCTVCSPKVFPRACEQHFGAVVKGPHGGCGNAKCLPGTRCKSCKKFEAEQARAPHTTGEYGLDAYATVSMDEPCVACPKDAQTHKPLLERTSKEENSDWQKKVKQALELEYKAARQEWADTLGDDLPSDRQMCPTCDNPLQWSADGWVCDDCNIETVKPEPVEDDDEAEPEPIDREPTKPNRRNEILPESEDAPAIEVSLVDRDGSMLDLPEDEFRDAEATYSDPRGKKRVRFGYQQKNVRRKIKKINWPDTLKTLRAFHPRWAKPDTVEKPNTDRREYTLKYNVLYLNYQNEMSFPAIAEHFKRVFGIKTMPDRLRKIVERFEEAASWVSDIRKDGVPYYSAREVSDALGVPQSDLISKKKRGRFESTQTDVGAGFMFTLKQFQVLAKKLNRVPITKSKDQANGWDGFAHLPAGAGESVFSRQSIRSSGVPSTKSYLSASKISGPSLPGPCLWLPLPEDHGQRK